MLDEEISRLLFIREEPVQADLAIVLAASDEAEMIRRVSRGVQMYKEGFVPKLLLTGGIPLARNSPGSKTMVEVARDMNVPDEDLLMEPESRNTFENMARSCNVLKQAELFEQLKKVLLVTSEWHMRRSFLSARRIFPEHVEFVCVPPEEGCTRETWTESEACRKEVLREMLLFQTFNDLGAF